MQTSVNSQMTVAKAGMVADLATREVRSYSNTSFQKSTVTVTSANLETVATVNGTAYVFDKKTVTVTSANAATVATVNGTAYTANTAAGTATKTAIATELVALINAGETLCTAEVVGETCVVTNVSAAITVVGTTNCTVAQTAVSTTLIATGLVSRINTGEGSEITATSNAAIITLVADLNTTSYTVVGTTNCTVTRITDAPATIPFGVLVCIDPDDNNKCKLPAVAADITSSRAIGFTKVDESEDASGFATGEMVAVLKKGQIWVVAEEAVSPGDTVYVRYTANGTGKTVLGAVRNDVDSTTAGALAGAEILDYDSNTSLALIAINRP